MEWPGVGPTIVETDGTVWNGTDGGVSQPFTSFAIALEKGARPGDGSPGALPMGCDSVLISVGWECDFPDDGPWWCFLPHKVYTPLYSERRQEMALTFPRESEMRGPDKSVTTRRTYDGYRLSTNQQSKDRTYHLCWGMTTIREILGHFLR